VRRNAVSVSLTLCPAERLQKIISAAGVTLAPQSRGFDLLPGRVQVNGQVATELGTKADPEHDHIRVDGKLLRGPERHTYIVLNKPKGYVTTVSDPEKRTDCDGLGARRQIPLCIRWDGWIGLAKGCWCSPMTERSPTH